MSVSKLKKLRNQILDTTGRKYSDDFSWSFLQTHIVERLRKKLARWETFRYPKLTLCLHAYLYTYTMHAHSTQMRASVFQREMFSSQSWRSFQCTCTFLRMRRVSIPAPRYVPTKKTTKLRKIINWRTNSFRVTNWNKFVGTWFHFCSSVTQYKMKNKHLCIHIFKQSLETWMWKLLALLIVLPFFLGVGPKLRVLSVRTSHI